MATLTHPVDWVEEHTYGFLEMFRIVLGLILLQKGVLFISDSAGFAHALETTATPFGSFWLGHYIIMAHLVGGLMIMIGLLTRWAALAQLPILAGAVVFVSYHTDNFIAQSTTLGLALFTLVLVLLFSFFGSGRFSVDNYLARQSDPEAEQEIEEVTEEQL